MRRLIPFDSGRLDDEETVHAADQIHGDAGRRREWNPNRGEVWLFYLGMDPEGWPRADPFAPASRTNSAFKDIGSEPVWLSDSRRLLFDGGF